MTDMWHNVCLLKSACGHADPSTSSGSSWAESKDEPRTWRPEARHQRKFALGVGPSAID